MQKRFELTYDELFILLKEAYHNGYSALCRNCMYEIK